MAYNISERLVKYIVPFFICLERLKSKELN